MITKTFKIKSAKLLKNARKGYVFTAAKNSGKQTFTIPKSQVISFDQIIIFNEDTKCNEHWLEISVTQWLWSKAKLNKKLKYYKLSSDVIIDNETHFGINWDYVIKKRKNRNSCMFCHGNISDSTRTKDHLVPREIFRLGGLKGGIANNTVPCCLRCNKEKANMHPEVYIEFVKEKIHETGNPMYRIILFNLQQCVITK